MASGHTGGYRCHTHQDIIRPVIPERSRLIPFRRIIVIRIDPRIGKIPPGPQHLELVGTTGIGNYVIVTLEIAGGGNRCGGLRQGQCGSKQDKADYGAIYSHYDCVIK